MNKVPTTEIKNNINKEFIPYTEALTLKELGFDEPCFKKYIVGCLWSNPTTPEVYKNIHANSSDCLTPLYQQAFRWFMEKYNIDGFIQIEPLNKKYGYVTYDRKKGNYTESEKKYTPEKAELECLKKLIEIIK